MTDCGGEGDHRILVVTTTVGSVEAAASLARGMIERRVAACVQIDREVMSFYRWQGQLCEEREARLVVKTAPACEAALRAFLAEHHPYEVPQFVAMAVPASAEYARWVRDEVSAPGAAAGDGPASS